MAIVRKTRASDDFNRADNADLGAAWDRYTGWQGGKIVSNQVMAAALTVSDAVESYNGVSLPANQWAQCTIVMYADSGNAQPGLVLRAAAPNTKTMYEVLCGYNTGDVNIGKWVAASFTSLANGGAVTSGDVLRAEVIGTIITGYVNGVAQVTADDSAIASGARAGIDLYTEDDIANAIIDDWSCGVFIVSGQIQANQTVNRASRY